jgi:hypothetical protein
MKRRVYSTITFCMAMVGTVTCCWAQQATSADSVQEAEIIKREVDKPDLRTTSQKRQWLREQVRNGVHNPNQIRVLDARINQLTVRQVNALYDSILAQQLPQDDQRQLLQQAQLELVRAQTLQQVLSDRLAWERFNRVGYLPVITWLPDGTSFGANAVVSPDGRHVRINANPMFSNVGPVYTYNLNTGETLPWIPQTSYPTYWNRPLGTPLHNSAYNTQMGQMPQQHLPPPPPSAYPDNVWHDGLRTRVGPRR